uniref:Uncharacterized protein n=1 Tax=Marseillevirus LCMAC101 TaxID=2506602 RepID=A0A481YTQ3_9VIRU|nr:MAG: uncharacterized protein LCMAC101_07500 [Marseillevirus LCMAC101]
MSKTTLKLEKLLDLLHKHRYILVSVYCEGGDIRFVECRTPKYQKTFIVYVPPAYSMKCGTNISTKQVDITLSKNNPTDRQINFMSDMKGPLLECDLLSVSSSTLCMYKNSGKMQCYSIKEDEESDTDIIEEEQVEEETDEITSLEKDTARVLQKIDPKNKLATPKIKEQTHSPDSQKSSQKSSKQSIKTTPSKTVHPSKTTLSNPPDDELTEDQMRQQEELLASKVDEVVEGEVVEGEVVEGEASERESSGGEASDAEDSGRESSEGEASDGETELVFEDEEGNVIEDVEGTLNKAGDIKEKGVESVDVISTGDNSIPEEIEDSDISLGIVYIVIAIGSFFKKINKYEENIVEICEQLDDNELDARKDRLVKIKDIAADFLEHSEKRLKEINQKEMDMKADLLRLTVILAQVDAMKTEIASNERRLRGETPSVEKLYIQTKKSVHEINLELLRLRDQADEILSNYYLSIKELMEL